MLQKVSGARGRERTLTQKRPWKGNTKRGIAGIYGKAFFRRQFYGGSHQKKPKKQEGGRKTGKKTLKRGGINQLNNLITIQGFSFLNHYNVVRFGSKRKILKGRAK